MAYISVISTTENSIRVQLAGCDTSYSATDRTCSWYINGSFKRVVSIGARVSTAAAYTFTGLSSDTRYNISAVITNGTWTSTETATAWTDAPAITRPSNWYWSSSELNAFNYKRSIKALTRARWNEFLDKINDFVEYVNASDGRSISYLSSSYYMGSDRKLYANDFNAVVGKIKELTGHSLSGITLPRRRGDPIKGVYFQYMSDILNSI